jgi:hypothetical protein
VAVIALAPAADAPMQADIALCSDSTATNSVSTSPLATYDEKYWGTSVDGVIGNAATTSGFICFMAIATASLPLNLSLIAILFASLLAFLYKVNGFERTDLYAYAAAFAVIIIKIRSFSVFINQYGSIGTYGIAKQALLAFILKPDRFHGTPVSRFKKVCVSLPNQ